MISETFLIFLCGKFSVLENFPLLKKQEVFRFFLLSDCKSKKKIGTIEIFPGFFFVFTQLFFDTFACQRFIASYLK